MDYEVILTDSAKTQLDDIIESILSEHENAQAALGIIHDLQDYENISQ